MVPPGPAVGVIPIVQQVTMAEDRPESKGRTGLVGNWGNPQRSSCQLVPSEPIKVRRRRRSSKRVWEGHPPPRPSRTIRSEGARIANVVAGRFFPALLVLCHLWSCANPPALLAPFGLQEIIFRRSLTVPPPEEGLRPPSRGSARHFSRKGADAHSRVSPRCRRRDGLWPIHATAAHVANDRNGL